MRYHHVTHLLSSKEARVYSFQLQDLSGGRWQASEHAFFWNQLPKKLIIVWQWQNVLSGWSLLMEGVCVEACVFVFTYLLHWGLPAHVFKRGRSEPCCARGPLLKKQNHTFGVLSQFNNEVFQLPSHLVYGHTHKPGIFNTHGVCGTRDYSSSRSICGSHHCLEVDLDDLITGVDLSGQVCWRLGGKKQQRHC